MPIFRLVLEYNGSAYHGWQLQSGLPTIQGSLEQALWVALRRPVSVTGSGRTDSGVHARGQVAHFVSEEPVDCFRLLRSLNGILPEDIAVLSIDPAPPSFHARYSATERHYHYHACTRPRALDRHMRWYVRPAPDFDRMNAASALLAGPLDCDAFCLSASETENRRCVLRHAIWIAEGREGDWRFEIAADRFLHGMVRAIVGTLVEIGHGKRPVDDIRRVLASRDRRQAGPAAPAHGLVLHAVRYGPREN